MVPVPCSVHIGCCRGRACLLLNMSPPCSHGLLARAYLQTRSGVVWASLGKTFLALCTRTASVCVRACVRLCAGGRGREGAGGTSCSIHQNARIVFSHGGAASRACRGRHGAKARARSARTASSDQYGLMPFFFSAS